jgi:hypothetical protein
MTAPTGRLVRTGATYTAIVAASLIVAVVGVLAYDARQHPIAWSAVPQYLSGQSIFLPDPELGFVVRPDLDAPGNTPERDYYTDARASRVAAPHVPVPARVDFFSVGDSQTLGFGVRSEETFTAVLARNTGLVGLNFGMIGYGGVGSLLMMRRELDLRPKFVVYGFWEDHLNRNVGPCLESGMPFCTPRPIVAIASGQPRIRLPDDPLAALSRARRWYGHGGPPFLKDLAAAASRNWGAVATWWSGRGPAVVSPSVKLQASLYVLDQMKRTADLGGAKLVVVYLPVYFSDVINDVSPEMATFARDTGIALVDMAPRLRAMKRAGQVIAIPGDGHMTAAVHRAVAEEIISACPWLHRRAAADGALADQATGRQAAPSSTSGRARRFPAPSRSA